MYMLNVTLMLTWGLLQVGKIFVKITLLLTNTVVAVYFERTNTVLAHIFLKYEPDACAFFQQLEQVLSV